jgi:hypothetical protein
VEAFEQFVAVALETEGFVVSEAVKFNVTAPTARKAYDEVQTHGFEVDLVAARVDRLVMATVKSFFGSRGVVADHVTGTTPNPTWRKRYALLNEPNVRDAVLSGAAARYGYSRDQIQLRLYVGRFAGKVKGTSETHEQRVRAWCAAQHVGAGPIEVIGVQEVVAKAMTVAQSKQYRDNPSLVAIKVLHAAGVLHYSAGS